MVDIPTAPILESMFRRTEWLQKHDDVLNTQFKKHQDFRPDRITARNIAQKVLSEDASKREEEAVAIVNKNHTAIITYDPKDHNVTVCFDSFKPMHWFSDGLDLTEKTPEEHSLGGQVPGQLYEKMLEKMKYPDLVTGAKTMVEAVEAHIHNFASRDYNSPLIVNYAGFSVGGVIAVIAGENIKNGLYDDYSEIKIGSIYAFGSVGNGDEEYKEILEDKVETLGGHIWDICMHGDTGYWALTPDSDFFPMFTKNIFTHVGTPLYITFGDNPSVMLNPTKEQISALGPAEKETHVSDFYMKTLEDMKSEFLTKQAVTKSIAVFQQEIEPPQISNNIIITNF